MLNLTFNGTELRTEKAELTPQDVYFSAQHAILRRRRPINAPQKDLMETKQKLFKMKMRFFDPNRLRFRQNEQLDKSDISSEMKISRKRLCENLSALHPPHPLSKKHGSGRGGEQIQVPRPPLVRRFCTTSTDTRAKPLTYYPNERRTGDNKWLFQNRDMHFYLNIIGMAARKRAPPSRNPGEGCSKSFCIQDQPAYLRPRIYMVNNPGSRRKRPISSLAGEEMSMGSAAKPANKSPTKTNAGLGEDTSRQDIAMYQNVLLKNHMILQKLKAALVANPGKTAEIMFKVKC